MTIFKAFESEKNKKALMYTIIICGLLLLMFILISWRVKPPSEPVVQDLIEINLGNNQDGFGEEQPLIKGERSPTQEETSVPKQVKQQEEEVEKVTPDDNAEATAAPVNKPVKVVPKTTTPVKETKPVVTPAPTPAKPKAAYNGVGNGGGNNATEDNGYKYQGNNPGGKGDAGDPNGNKDSYGNTPGGKIGGPKVIGNRTIVRYYSFTGELPKATIYAMIKVSPSGQGSFQKLVKPSTSFDNRYSTAIINYLKNMEFNKTSSESEVTVVFNFTVN